MSRRPENLTTSQNSKNGKSIPEMTWDEIIALPTENIPNKKINEFLKKEGVKRKK